MTQVQRVEAYSLVKKALSLYLETREILCFENLSQPFSSLGASFVTINKLDGTLRGCMGSIIPTRTLGEDLVRNAISSATGDPRFPPMVKDELENVTIDISILSPLKKVEFSDWAELSEKITSFEDGVIIKKGEKQSTFLPSVWEQIASKEEFFSALCQKAGLEASSYKDPSLEVYIYKTIKITQQDL